MAGKFSLKELKNLQEDDEIDLSARQLTEVPGALHMISRLTHVDLSNNRITVLPAALCKMTRLIKLDLGKNRIHHLPNEFGNLVNLQHLNLYRNEIEELPLSFSNLKSLKWLDLKENPLTDKLEKVVGNCGTEKECKAAAVNAVQFMSEEVRFLEHQKEKEKKVHEKIQKKKVEEKMKRNKNVPVVKKENEHTKASNTVHQKETSKSSKDTREKKMKYSNDRKENVQKNTQRRGIIRRTFGFVFSVAYYVSLAVFAASTVTILMNCSNGGKQIAGSKPLCADLTKLSQFEKPSAQFLANIRNTYGTVLAGYDRQAQPYYKPAVAQFKTHWNKFSKTDAGRVVDRSLYQAHAWVVEKSLLVKRSVETNVKNVQSWYNKDGHKAVGRYVEGFKIGLNMVYEISRDILLQIYNGLVHVAKRGQKFANAWMEGGLQAAMKTLN